VKAVLSAVVIKTDRKDARGIAQLLRMGWFRPVHAKSPGAQEVRALLVARKLLQTKLLDVEFSIRGILRGFGLKMGAVSKGRFVAPVRELAAGHPMLELITEPMLRAREALRTEYARLHGEMLALAKPDPVCRRLMTAPDVGALLAITFKSGVDDPGRFTRSRVLGAYFGLTPKKYQSGETDVTGAISRVGDAMVRVTLYEAANIILSRVTRFSSLKRWALDVAKRRGLKRAKVALARKLATILHRMWIDGTTFHWGKRRRRITIGDVFRGGANQLPPPEVPLPGRGSGEAVGSTVATHKAGPRVGDWLAGSPSDGMMWRPACRPRTEARSR
jgi:transposase